VLKQNVPKEEMNFELSREDSVFSSKFDSGMDLTYCQVKLEKVLLIDNQGSEG